MEKKTNMIIANIYEDLKHLAHTSTHNTTSIQCKKKKSQQHLHPQTYQAAHLFVVIELGS